MYVCENRNRSIKNAIIEYTRCSEHKTKTYGSRKKNIYIFPSVIIPFSSFLRLRYMASKIVLVHSQIYYTHISFCRRHSFLKVNEKEIETERVSIYLMLLTTKIYTLSICCWRCCRRVQLQCWFFEILHIFHISQMRICKWFGLKRNDERAKRMR